MEPKRPSIAAQRQALRHCLALLGGAGQISDEIRRAAEAGIATLEWLDKRRHLTRALAELDRDAPELLALLDAFPGATITAVRETPR